MTKSRSGNAPPAIPIAGHMPRRTPYTGARPPATLSDSMGPMGEFVPRRVALGAMGIHASKPKPKPIVIQEGAPVGSFKPGTEARVKVAISRDEVKW